MLLDMSKRDEHGTKHREHQGLDVAYKNLKQHHEDAQRYRDNGDTASGDVVDQRILSEMEHDENHTRE